MKPDCHGVAVKIEEICREYQIRLETFWLSRGSKEIELCDNWSKENLGERSRFLPDLECASQEDWTLLVWVGGKELDTFILRWV